MGRRQPRKKQKPNLNLWISNKSLTILICILAVVCLFAGGIYIDTFYGKGMFQSFVSQMKQTEPTETKEEAPAESMAVDISSKATMAVFGKEFMLCTKDKNGVVSTYICNNGITLKYGKELYEDRLHLSENITGVQYESRTSWYQSMGEIYELDMDEAYIQDFISQLSTEKFLLCQNVVEQEGWNHMVDSEIYHLYFTMNNGTKIHLRLHENGYVRFQGLTDLCVKIPDECYDTLITIFAQNTGTPVANVQGGM